MADIVSKQKRSQMMSGIQGKNTRPELMIRKALHAGGFRYRLHNKRLPGKPDLVFPKYNAVIFVNGCFWHCHDCHLFKWPSTRQEFWKEKIEGNAARDKGNYSELAKLGWRIAIIWECSLKGKTRLPVEEMITLCEFWLLSEQQTLEITGNE